MQCIHICYMHNTYLRTGMPACLPTYIHTYTHTYIHAYIHTYIHTHTQYTHVYIYIYTHTHAFIHTYVHTYIHSYICVLSSRGLNYYFKPECNSNECRKGPAAHPYPNCNRSRSRVSPHFRVTVGHVCTWNVFLPPPWVQNEFLVQAGSDPNCYECWYGCFGN